MIKPNFIIDNSSINAVKARVSIYDGSSIWGGTLVQTCTCSDYLQNFSVSRVGESGKFFGFGICQQIKLTLVDLEKELTITKGMAIKAEYGDGTNFVSPHPLFFVEEAVRNEENNTIDITAYDAIYKASSIKLADAEIIDNFVTPYNPKKPSTLLATCAYALGLTSLYGVLNIPNEIIYDNEPNFDGTETIADVLRTIAETAQAFYYINGVTLTIKRLDFANEPVLTITKNDYFTLKIGENITLDNICHTTELGNNTRASAGAESGIIQYIRDNAYWTADSEEKIASYVDSAWSNLNGISINQFTCEDWIGNYLLEIGDKIAFETEDGSYITSYLLDDVISFDGTLSQTTRWAYEVSAEETASNPSNLGEMLSKTYARVDKVNKEITLLSSEVDKIAKITIDTDGIYGAVENVQANLNNALEGVNGEIETLTNKVEATMTAEEIQIQISNTLATEGAEKVKTSSEYTFDENGLHISKSGSGVENLIDNTGMYVKRDGENILVANTNGVEATNLHAKTYLIIGENSRFEDYYNNGNRTGCFFIGG